MGPAKWSMSISIILIDHTASYYTSLHFAERYKHIQDVYVTSSQVTPRGGRRHTVGHVTGGKAHHTTLQCCHLHALAQSNRQAAHMNLAANTMGGEHTCCRHTMPAHGSSHHGWRIITDNAGSRQLIPRVEYNSHTMPAHGSSHHGWRIIHTQCRLTAAHTTGGE